MHSSSSTTNSKPFEAQITGLGVTSAVGHGKTPFFNGLMSAHSAFGVMQRPGRQHPDGQTAFLGAEMADVEPPFSKRLLRTASLTAKASLTCIDEAWREARLDELVPQRIGLIVGGANTQQRELLQVHQAYADRLHFIRPTHGLAFMDTDICGLAGECFPIRAFAHTLGGASASGQLAIIHAAQAVQSGLADAVIAVGALMDLSYFELRGLQSLGAMGSNRWANQPDLAARPFDSLRDGFIFGESSAAVVIERTGLRTPPKTYATISGKAVVLDGTRSPSPSYEGERAVIQQALADAQLAAAAIDYIKPHGSGSIVGDETELKALAACNLRHAHINTTKSIVGHGLTAAGAVELVAALLQMEAGQLHPCRNLEQAIDTNWRLVGSQPEAVDIQHALCMSMGFGGLNTALILSRVGSNQKPPKIGETHDPSRH